MHPLAHDDIIELINSVLISDIEDHASGLELINAEVLELLIVLGLLPDDVSKGTRAVTAEQEGLAVCHAVQIVDAEVGIAAFDHQHTPFVANELKDIDAKECYKQFKSSRYECISEDAFKNSRSHCSHL